jgi:hypothetical protein
MPSVDSQLAFTIEQAVVASGRSRSRIFLAIKNRELSARKDGRRTLVEREELLRWIKSLPFRDPMLGRDQAVA